MGAQYPDEPSVPVHSPRHGREKYSHEPGPLDFVPGARQTTGLGMAAWQGAASIAASAAEDAACDSVRYFLEFPGVGS